jgi:hypothetical protein
MSSPTRQRDEVARLVLFFYRILKKGAFPNGFKARKAMNPSSGPATPAEARVRLEGALAGFDQEEGFVRFSAIHTRHHGKQMPGAA